MRQMSFISKFSIVSFFLMTFPVFSADLNFYQVKLGGGYFNTGDGMYLAPFVGFAKRFEIGDSAVEVSTIWAESNHNGEKLKYFSLPKITYLKFHNPQANESIFYGGGLSWSRLGHDDNHFSGVFGEATVGYEFKRNATICPIVHLDLIQPLVAESKEGSHPGPSIMLGMSVGFN